DDDHHPLAEVFESQLLHDERIIEPLLTLPVDEKHAAQLAGLRPFEIATNWGRADLRQNLISREVGRLVSVRDHVLRLGFSRKHDCTDTNSAKILATDVDKGRLRFECHTRCS